jgi:FMN phosphatase YigB (HAD superfamily)
MIRAVLFDFYSVWLPDIFTEYLASAQQQDPALYAELNAAVEKYYQGEVDIVYVTDVFRYKLSDSTIDAQLFRFREQDISPEAITFMRNLHSHFIKLGILANLGKSEFGLLEELNKHNQLFELIACPASLQIRQPLLTREVFVAALNLIGEPPANCLIVTGNLDYSNFANSLGINTVKFDGFPELTEYMNYLLTNNMM